MPQPLLSRVETLERITFDNCHRWTNTGVAHLARLRVNSHGVTRAIREVFAVTVDVDIEG